MKAAVKEASNKYADDDLRTMLSLHAIALSEMAQGLCVIDAHFRVVLFNPRFAEIIGIRSDLIHLGASLGVIFDAFDATKESLSSASAEMWHEIKSMCRRGEPFRLHQKFHKSVVIALDFRPTQGGGWVLTCDQLSQKSEVQGEIDVLKPVIESASRGVCIFDADRNFAMWNERYLQIYGYARGIIRPGMSFLSVFQNAMKLGIEVDEMTNPAGRLAELFKDEEVTERHCLRDGRVIEAHVIPLESGGWMTEHEDVTVKLRHEHALQERNRLLDAVLDHMVQGLCAFDDELKLIVVNRRYLEMYCLTFADASPGTPLVDLMRCSVARGIHCDGISAEEMFADFKKRLIENKEPELHRQLSNGRVVAVRHQPMLGGGWVGTYEDITERYRAQEDIARIARHDALTGLPNRFLFGEKMAESLARVAEGDAATAVMCFDLDNFKAINDSLGHPTGDKVLQEIAGRLRAVIGSEDTFARLGGDEFAIIHPRSDAQDAERLASQLNRAISPPLLIDGQEIHSSICIGIAMAPEHGRTADQLMKCADLALYRAKAQGRNSWRLFDPQMDAEIQARRLLEVDLHRALTADEFHLNYQPLINLSTNEIVGAEVLLRWTHPQRGSIEPSEFIPIAEETGLVVPLGEWVLRRACAEAQKWPSSIRLSVNLSPLQFRNRAFVSVVISALAASGLPASRLEFEITEATLMQNDESILAILHQLRGLGVRIAMDDFGTGYSSLSYLRKFPFDRIKIDRSFIADSDLNSESAVIVRTIAALGQALCIETTAEGIESTTQLDLVRQAGCTEGQGYLISRPRSAEDIYDFIAKLQRVGTAA
jgi:diguanylate cyclase (GGDEF)-like protein